MEKFFSVLIVIWAATIFAAAALALFHPWSKAEWKRKFAELHELERPPYYVAFFGAWLLLIASGSFLAAVAAYRWF